MTAAVRFGSWLRAARERRGLTPQQLATQTSIPLGHLEALEAGLLHAIPARLYRRAEARAYAEAVGLDPGLVLSALQDALAPPPPLDGAGDEPLPVDVPQMAAVTSQGSAADVPVIVPRVRAATPAVDDASSRGGRSDRPWWLAATLVLVLAAAAFLFDRAAPSSIPLDAAAAGSSIDADEAAVEPVPAAPAYLRTHTPADEASDEPRTVASKRSPRAAPSARRPGASVRRPPATPAPAGVLVVHTAPRGARVTVNGIGWGATPVTIRNLPPGPHRVRVVMDRFVSVERVVQLTAGQSRRLTIPLKEAR